MWVWQLLTQVAGHHLIPCLLASLLMYAALQLLFSVGLVRQAAHRVLFLYAALAKAALALWVGESVSYLSSDPKLFGYLGVRLPNLMPSDTPYDPGKLAAVLTISDFAGWVLVGIVVSAGVLLLHRWVKLAPVYRSIYARLDAGRSEHPEAFRVFDELVAQTYGAGSWLPKPRLLLVRGAQCSAFTMGVRSPVIVLSAELATQLGRQELKGVLAHEIAHVRRLDYLGRWGASILRDILFWNPIAVLWFERLTEEQEKACDRLAARWLDDPSAVASGLVEVAAHSVGLPVLSVGPLNAWGAGRRLGILNRRLEHLAGDAQGPVGMGASPLLMPYTAFLAFALAQPRVAFSIPDVLRLVTLSH